MTKIVFLHIPKTAGQTVHNEIAKNMKAAHVSPIRVHTQAQGASQYPPGYAFYSGHLDWPQPDQFDDDAFLFTILRDPRERIASFYFYLLKEAQKMAGSELVKPQHTGKRMVLTRSADAYFFGGSVMWQRFIRDHYDNVYARYFASGRLRGYGPTKDLTPAALLGRAQEGLERVSRVYHVANLRQLEQDLLQVFGMETQLVGNFQNSGRLPQSTSRWSTLLDQFETDRARHRLETFVQIDDAFVTCAGLAAAPDHPSRMIR